MRRWRNSSRRCDAGTARTTAWSASAWPSNSNAHWVAAGMSTEELIVRGYELAKRIGLQDHRAYLRRNILAGKGLSEISAGNRPHRRALSDAARHPRSAMDSDPRHPCAPSSTSSRWRGSAAASSTRRPASRSAAAGSRRSPTRSAPASTSRSAPTDRWSTTPSTWSSR